MPLITLLMCFSVFRLSCLARQRRPRHHPRTSAQIVQLPQSYARRRRRDLKRVLRTAHQCAAADRHFTSLLVDGVLAVDAGSLTSALTLEEQDAWFTRPGGLDAVLEAVRPAT